MNTETVASMGELLQFQSARTAPLLNQCPGETQSGTAGLTLAIRPTTIRRAWPVLQQHNPELTPLLDVVMHDPGLAAQILKTALCEGADPADLRMSDCLVSIGAANLASALSDAARRQEIPDDSVESVGAHSRLTALIAERLATASGSVSPERAYLAALLHDIGHLVESPLDRFATLRWSHTNLGQQLCEDWGLPAYLSDVVANHHHPEAASVDPDLVRLVSFANQLANTLGPSCIASPASATHSSPADLLRAAIAWADAADPKVVHEMLSSTLDLFDSRRRSFKFSPASIAETGAIQ